MSPHSLAGAAPPPTGLARPYRSSGLTFVVLAVLAVAAALLVRSVTSGQEERLLRERTSEVAAVLTTVVTGFESSLEVLGGVAVAEGQDLDIFTETAQPMVGPGALAVGLARVDGAAVTAEAGVGTAPGRGAVLDPARAAVVARAARAGDMAAGLVHEPDGAVRLFVAVPAPGTDDLATYQEIPFDPTTPVVGQTGTPFADMRVAVYASEQATDASLLLTSEPLDELPLGRSEQQLVPVGVDSWLLVMAADAPLGGALAANAPWMTLLTGLVGALLLAVLVETLVRRRSYAVALADERTVELRDALADLGRTRRLLQRLLDAGETAALRWGAQDHRVNYVSPNMERIVGIPGEAVVDEGGLGERVAAEHRPDLDAAVSRVLTGDSERESLELLLCDETDGQRWVAVLVVADRADDGTLQGVVAYLRDVDERHRAEAELRQREATLRAAFTASPDVLTVLGPDGVVRSVSPALRRLMGHEPAAMEGRPLLELVHPDHRDAVTTALRAVLAEPGEPAAVQFESYHRDGYWVMVDAQLAGLGHDGDQAGGIVMSARDVSDRVRLERAQAEAREAAEAANTSKSEFLSRMSHELRTPLNAVLGFAQVLELDELNADQEESVAQILKGGRHLLALINEVLDISRIEAGTMTLSPEAVQVRELLDECVDLVQPLAHEHSIRIETDRADSCQCYVLADRQRVKQVMLNLLSNALKYNRVGGSVRLSCVEGPGSTVRIAVSDTGPGIRADQRHLLFRPFERLGADLSGVEGTGIGLALSRQLATAMGGSLDLDSSPGEGSTFWVELPRVEGPVERYERLSGPVAAVVEPEPGSLRHSVVYIEDNLANMRLVERVLGARGDVEVIPAMQGRLGLELVRQHRPVLVLLDLHLPDLGGEEVLEQLREDPATASIPVVMVSADATPRQVQRLLHAGAAAYLTKPLDLGEFGKVLDDLLQRA